MAETYFEININEKNSFFGVDSDFPKLHKTILAPFATNDFTSHWLGRVNRAQPYAELRSQQAINNNI